MPKPRKDEINWDAVDAAAQGVMPEWGVLLRDHVFKEIPALTFHADRQDDEAERAWHELYGTWWRFLVANHAVRSPGEADQAEPELVGMLADFVPLGDDFGRWWRERGRELFTETRQLPFVRVLQANHEDGQNARPTSIVLEVPLTIPRQLILEQLRYVFDAYHQGDKLERHRYSTARRRIHPRQRYHKERYERLLEIWVHRRSHPEEEWWLTGELLRLSPALIVQPGDDAMARSEKRRDLGTMTRKLHEQAERMMYHALRGRFPCDDEIPADRPPRQAVRRSKRGG